MNLSSAHFRSKWMEARRSAREASGMISFYWIVKETLDYRNGLNSGCFLRKADNSRRATN